MDIPFTQFPEFRPPADKPSSPRNGSKSRTEQMAEAGHAMTARMRASTIESGDDAKQQAADVAQTIRDRQASGFYHRPDVLREIAARLMASPELGEGFVPES